jgi:flagellar motility protein MotE (MotC chaperone)
MSKLLKSPWVLVLLGMAVYAATTAYLLQPSELNKLSQKARGAPRHKARGFTWQTDFPELTQLMEDLRKNKEDLTAREQQLQELMARLQTERKELNEATQAVALLQKEFDQNIVRVKDDEVANLKKMAKVYANMTPEGAASILKNMEDTQVVKYLAFMKEAETAPILEAFAKLGEGEPKRAALILDKLRTASYRSSANKSL